MFDAAWQAEPGLPYPLGATVTPDGINFALYSRGAERAVLCLFGGTNGPERLQVDLPARTGHVWHGFLPGLTAGQLYGYRVHGPYDPPSDAASIPRSCSSIPIPGPSPVELTGRRRQARWSTTANLLGPTRLPTSRRASPWPATSTGKETLRP
jgi:1,4-alpha-glucan branching enzyme